MSSWLAQLPAVALTVGLLVLPGLPVALLARVRGLLRIGVAISVSLAIIALASIVAPILGISWSLIPVLLIALAVTAVAGVLSISLRERYIPIGRRGGVAWAASGVAIVGWVAVVVLGIASPDHPNQLYDGLFHLNAVEFVAITGNASPLSMTMVTPNSSSAFYPTLWHALVSLVVPVSGGVTSATNVVTVIAIAVIWPVAVAALSVALFPKRRGIAVWAPLVTFAFSVFPLGFLNWGVLYPNLLGPLLLPILLATVIIATRRGLVWPQRVLLLLVALAAAGATALAHPSALLAGVALLVPSAVHLLCPVWRDGSGVRRSLLAAAFVVCLVVLVATWHNANVTTNEWLPNMTLAQAFGEIAFLSPVGRAAGLVLGPLAGIGVWRTVRERRWWVIASFSVSAGLYLFAAWFPVLAVRSWFVGVWYDDATRVGALLAIFGLPFAALGATVVADWIKSSWRSGGRKNALLVSLLILALAVTHLHVVRSDLRYMRNVSFAFGSESQGLSPDEVELFVRASALMSDEDLTIGDPLTGAGLFYAYSGHDVVFPHVTGRYGADAALLARTLAEGTPDVCEAIDRLGVTYAFDFGDREIFENHYTTYDGLHDLSESPILDEVERVGDAALYKITGCS